MEIAISDIFDSLDAGVYISDMKTRDLLYVNKYMRDLFGDVVGKKSWAVLQSGQSGSCSFCTNDKLLTPEGKGVNHAKGA